LVEKACHDFDILGWLIDDKTLRVTATGGISVYTGRDTLDHATVAVEYQSGIKLSFGLCMFAKRHQANTTLIGTKGMLNFPRKGGHITLRRQGKPDKKIDLAEEELDQLEGLRHRGTGRLHIEFCNAVNAGRQPFADVNVGYNALTIPIAAQTAISQHKIIDMSHIASR
jgi:predicted dehydrogenase